MFSVSVNYIHLILRVYWSLEAISSSGVTLHVSIQITARFAFIIGACLLLHNQVFSVFHPLFLSAAANKVFFSMPSEPSVILSVTHASHFIFEVVNKHQAASRRPFTRNESQTPGSVAVRIRLLKASPAKTSKHLRITRPKADDNLTDVSILHPVTRIFNSFFRPVPTASSNTFPGFSNSHARRAFERHFFSHLHPEPTKRSLVHGNYYMDVAARCHLPAD